MASPSIVNRPRLGSAGERPRSATGPQANECKELEKYVKYLFYKATQVIVQSRQGGKSFTESQPNPKNQSWFCLAINDNIEITHEAKKAAAMINNPGAAGLGILGHPLCIEISLKTSEGDSMVLENWVLTWRDSSDPNIRLNNTVYNHMGLLLKSLLCVTRSTPAYRLSRRQGPETFVICYRVYAGDPISSHLGDGYQSSGVGQVVTNVGTLQLRVDYRTQMTITPSCSSSSENFYLTSGNSNNPYSQLPVSSHANNQLAQPSVSGYGSGSLPIKVKQDHFFSDLLPGQQGTTESNLATANVDQSSGFNASNTKLNKNIFGGPNYLSGDYEANQTSDESQEAMRIFASSPPDPTSPYTKRPPHYKPAQPGNYSSNESLASGQTRFYRPRSGTNQSLGSTNEEDSEGKDHSSKDSSDLKMGAFVSSSVAVKNLNTLKSPLTETEDDLIDPLLELFTVESDKDIEKNSLDRSESREKIDAATKCDQGLTNKESGNPSSPMFIDRKLRSLTLKDKKDSDSPFATSPAKKIDFGTTHTEQNLTEKTEENLFKCLSDSSRGPADPFILLDFKTPFSNKTTEDAQTDLGVFFKEVHKGRDIGPKSVSVPKPILNNTTTANVSSPTLGRNDIEFEPARSSFQPKASPQKENLEGQLQYLNEKLSCFEENLEVFDDMLKNMEVTSVTSESESEIY